MKFFNNSRNNIIIIFLLFLVSELFVNPTGNFPLNDDWSYTHSVQFYLETGKIDLGYWPAMTLLSHIIWGKLVCQVFGFSFFMLRVSTLILALASAILTYKLLENISGNKPRSFIITLFLLFNPLFYSLSNTYMTDVPFVFTIIFSAFCIERYWCTKRVVWLLALCFACIHSVLIRQYGLAIGVGLVGSVFLFFVFQKERRRLWVILPVIILLLTYWLFDKWRLATSKEYSAYVSSTSILNREMLENLWRNFTMRYAFMALYSGVFLLPLLLPMAIKYLKSLKLTDLIFIIPVFSILTWFVRKWFFLFPAGNVFYNCGLGPQLLYDTTILNQNHQHSQSIVFFHVINALGLCGVLLINFCIASGIWKLAGKLKRKESISFVKLYIVLFAFAYLLMTSYTDSFFDRYTLPVIFCSMLFVSMEGFVNKLMRGFVVVYLCVTILFSVLATKDCFVWNQTKWDLISETVNSGVKPESIHGGIEYIAHTFYSHPWFGMWVGDGSSHYILNAKIKKYNKVGFKTYQRLLPYKTDTLFVYQKPHTPY